MPTLFSPPLVLRERVRVGVFVGQWVFDPHVSAPPEYQGRGKFFAGSVAHQRRGDGIHLS
jgi:hypothetical protein